MRVGAEQKPPGDPAQWERGLDQWHADAFPDEFKFVGKTGERKSGWFLLSMGEVIGFVADGTEIEHEETFNTRGWRQH